MRALLLFVLTASCAAALASAAAQTPLAAQRRAQVSHEKILQEHPTSARRTSPTPSSFPKTAICAPPSRTGTKRSASTRQRRYR
jgi:hypothetical protein